MAENLLPPFRGRQRSAWKKDKYTYKQYYAISKLCEEGLIPDSEILQIAQDIRQDTMTKGTASIILDKYLPLYKELKQREIEGCRITDPKLIQEIQDKLLEEQEKRKKKQLQRIERGSCIKG